MLLASHCCIVPLASTSVACFGLSSRARRVAEGSEAVSPSLGGWELHDGVWERRRPGDSAAALRCVALRCVVLRCAVLRCSWNARSGGIPQTCRRQDESWWVPSCSPVFEVESKCWPRLMSHPPPGAKPSRAETRWPGVGLL